MNYLFLWTVCSKNQNSVSSSAHKVVLIGASTGGPGQIQKIILALLPLSNTTIIIAQHMAKGFIGSFASRLHASSLNPVYVARNNLLIERSTIYVCSGFISIYKKDSQLYFQQESSSENKFNPDINYLFNSFTPFTKELDILSVILTGIGDDGVDGCKNLSIRGAKSLTESEKSAIVDGMPSRARNEVPGIVVLNIDGIIKNIKEFCD